MALGWLIPTLANQPRKNTFGKHLWSLWLLKNHDLCYLVCPRKYLMLPLSLQDEHAGDCDWHCPAEPLVIDTTKPGSKPFLKGPQSKHSNVEHKRLLLRVQRKAEHKPTPPWAQCDHLNFTHWTVLKRCEDSHCRKCCFSRTSMTLNTRRYSCGVFWSGVSVWGRFVICIFNVFKSVREQAETQNCRFWAQHLLLLQVDAQNPCLCTFHARRFLHHPPLSSKVRILSLHTGTKKLNFLCKALTYNSMSYDSTMMIPIRN